MKTRTVLYMVAAVLTYISLALPLLRARTQCRLVHRVAFAIPVVEADSFLVQEPVQPAQPTAAMEPSVPAVPSVPAIPAVPAMPAVPGVPAVPAAAATPAVPGVPGVPGVPAAPAVPFWEGEHSWGHSSWNHWGDRPAETCSDLHVRLRDDETPSLQSEEHTLTKAEAAILRIHELPNGGTQVQGWDKDTYSVTACKFAVGSDVQQLLSEIHLSVQGGDVSVSGPSRSDDDDWTVYLLVRTPRGANIHVTAQNGPISFYGVDGKITAHATNGPISLKNCSGEGDVSAQNGPISFSGTSGKLRLHTQNGPITVSLDSGWNGSELVADAVNGPVTLRVPSGFQSSFLVESSNHSPISCHASICSEARKTWDDEHRRIEYGSGSPVIRMSTENGPISVAD